VFSLKDKVSIVTGGNGGIGEGIAKGLANSGSKVAIIGRDKDKCEAVKEKINSNGGVADYFICDVINYDSVKDTIEKVNNKFGNVDILVNNAGTSIRKPPEKLTPDDWKYVMDVNLTSIHYFSSLIFDQMKNNNGGKIINIGSMMTIFGAGHASVYAASKGGVVQYSKSCAIAWAEHNIQVNSILPGYITTNMTDGFKKNFPKDAELVTSRIPAGRWGVPDDLAGTAIFLASSASDFVTGAFIPVDGGYSIR
jgi:2-deoxy-D-gluconate 3-dehydrogenase|tara:strand:- start:26 stop:781 length:756 start_codon:yes stop_codon:yes gene_type:complete